ncbi:MAG: MarC family protein [Pseudomonadota bacterium]
MSETTLITFIAALFSMMNPIGNVGIFAGMTADRSADEARRIAMTCAVAISATLIIATWTGAYLLKLFGINIHELRAAGGVIVLLIGLSMLRSDDSHRQTPAEAAEDSQRAQIAVVPLAIPIVAGPGAIATAIVAAERHPSIWAKVDLSFGIIALAALTGVLFAFSRPIAARLGKSGMGVVTRVMGMVLTAVAMGMLAEGVQGMIPALTAGKGAGAAG